MPPAPSNGNPDSDLLLEIANYVASGLNMVVGTNVFIGELPEPNLSGVGNGNMLYLIRMPSPSPDEYVDTETQLVDFWCSSADSSSGYTLLHQVYDMLQRKGNYALTNWYVYFSSASSTISDESRGREGNKLFSLSFRFITRNLNNIS